MHCCTDDDQNLHEPGLSKTIEQSGNSSHRGMEEISIHYGSGLSLSGVPDGVET